MMTNDINAVLSFSSLPSQAFEGSLSQQSEWMKNLLYSVPLKYTKLVTKMI